MRSELGGDDGCDGVCLPSVGAGDAIEPFAAISHVSIDHQMANHVNQECKLQERAQKMCTGKWRVEVELLVRDWLVRAKRRSIHDQHAAVVSNRWRSIFLIQDAAGPGSRDWRCGRTLLGQTERLLEGVAVQLNTASSRFGVVEKGRHCMNCFVSFC